MCLVHVTCLFHLNFRAQRVDGHVIEPAWRKQKQNVNFCDKQDFIISQPNIHLFQVSKEGDACHLCLILYARSILPSDDSTQPFWQNILVSSFILSPITKSATLVNSHYHIQYSTKSHSWLLPTCLPTRRVASCSSPTRRCTPPATSSTPRGVIQ